MPTTVFESTLFHILDRLYARGRRYEKRKGGDGIVSLHAPHTKKSVDLYTSPNDTTLICVALYTGPKFLEEFYFRMEERDAVERMYDLIVGHMYCDDPC